MYDGATYFAWFVFALLFFVAVGLVVWLGSLPLKIANRRNHPQADAINACSWIGLALGGVGWPIAFVWAFLHAGPIGYASTSSDDNQSPRVDELVEQIAQLKGQVEQLEKELKAEENKS